MEKTNKKNSHHFSTVGTSLFEKFKKENFADENFERDYDYLKEHEKESVGQEERIRAAIKKEENNFLDDDASAEIASITKFIKDKELEPQDVTLYFIITDTALSSLAAEFISDYLKESGFDTRVQGQESKYLNVISGLSVTNADLFNDSGLPKLAEKIRKIKNDEKDNEIFINITGGYKGVLPFMYLIAQMYDLQAFYLYETSEDLIYLPQIPVGFEPLLAEEYYYWLKEGIYGTYGSEGKTIKELKDLHFIEPDKDSKDKFQPTGMGNIFCNWVEDRNAAESPQTLGHLIEYKVFEAFFNAVYVKYDDKKTEQDLEESNEAVLREEPKFKGKTIKEIRHSDRTTLHTNNEEIAKLRGKEVDVLLTYDDDSKDFIEVKSLRILLNHNHFNDIEEQLIGKIRRIKSNKIKKATITFIFYAPIDIISLIKNSEDTKKDLKEKCDKLIEDGKNYGIDVVFRYMKIDRGSSSDAYSKLLNKRFLIANFNPMDQILK